MLVEAALATSLQAAVPATADLAPPVTISATRRLQELCDGDRLSLSPSGRYLAVWDSRRWRSGPVIFETDCLVGDAPCRGWAVVSISGVNSVLWGREDILFLVPGDGPVRRLDPAAGRLAVDPGTVLAGARDDTVLTGLVDQAGPRWSSRVDALGADYSLLGQTRMADGVHSTLLDRRDHRLALLGPTGPVATTDLSARWGRRLAPAFDQAGRPYLVGEGVVALQAEDGWRPAVPDLYQPRPVLDSTTGVLAGAFDDRRILRLDGGRWRAAPPAPDALDHIAEVAFASASGALAVRSRRLDGRWQVQITTLQGDSRRIDCPRPADLSGSAPPIAAPVVLEDWGTPDQPLPVRRRTLPGAARGTMVFWDGGPGSTFAMGGAFGLEQEWLRRGYNVALVDGAGSNGIDAGRRLRDEGFPAVVADARRAARHIARSAPEYGPVLVQGVSFGGAAAAEMARALSLESPASAPRLLLVSPWLQYRDPGDYVVRERGSPNIASLRRSDEAAFGPMGQGGYDARLAAWRDAYAFDGPTLVLFGGDDRMTRPEDLWTLGARTRVTIVEGRDHHRVGDAGETGRAIDRWLAEQPQ